MKLNVEVEFVDKVTGELHKVGEIITVDKARGEELLADNRNLVSLNEDAVEEKPKGKATKK